MRTRIFPALVIGLVMSSAAPAGEAIDAAALGNFDGLLAACREINPSGKEAYDTLREAIAGEQPEGVLEAVAATTEYKQAFQTAHEKAAAETPDVANKGCTQLAASLDPRVHTRPRPAKNSAGAKGATGAKGAKGATNATSAKSSTNK